jgi:flagellar biogenesis protein FliO
LNFSAGFLPLFSFTSDVLPLLFSLIAIVLVLYFCYIFSKFLTKKVNNVSKYNNIRIIERVALSQDKGLVIIELCSKYYLVGFSNNNVEILKELNETELHLQKPDINEKFLNILNSTIKSRWDVKLSDSRFKRKNKADSTDNEKTER